MILIGIPDGPVHEDRPDWSSVNLSLAQEMWPGSIAVAFNGAYGDLQKLGPAPTDADLRMVGGIDTRPYAMPKITSSVLSDAVKAECSRRIYAHVTAEEQTNMAAALPDAPKDDATTIRAVREWIGKMRDASKALISAADAGFTDDAKWPAWSKAWDAVVSAY